MLGFLRDFFVEHQPTIEDAYRKAASVEGWCIEETAEGHVVHGVNADDQPSSWQYGPDEVDNMNYLLDHVNATQIGDQYLQEYYGTELVGDTTGDANRDCEIKHEVRDYSTQTYYSHEYRPGWKRMLGL